MNRELILSPSTEGLSLAVSRLQTKLYEDLPWTEKVYGLASDGFRESTEKLTLTIPEVYKGNGIYEEVLPNGLNTSHIFFYADGPEKVEAWSAFGDSQRYSQRLSIVVWCDLEKIKATLGYNYDHRFTDELIGQMRRSLATQSEYEPETIERGAKQVWKNWTIGRGVLYYGDYKEYAMTQIFKHPEAGFRIFGNITYDDPCL